jgi:hypothetical protein
MAKTYYPKPRLVEQWRAEPKAPNEFCQKTKYDGKPHLCQAPTVIGRTYCEDCRQQTLTRFDRAPLPDQPAPKPYGWASDQIFPRKRA